MTSEFKSEAFICKRCHAALSGVAVGGICPQCQLPVVESLRSEEPGRKRSVAASNSLILAIFGAFVPLFGILAWRLAVEARREMRAGG